MDRAPVSYDATQQANRRNRTSKHLIAEVRYSQTVEQGLPIDQSPLLCTCGVVTTSGSWDHHRGLTVGARRKATAKLQNSL